MRTAIDRIFMEWMLNAAGVIKLISSEKKH